MRASRRIRARLVPEPESGEGLETVRVVDRPSREAVERCAEVGTHGVSFGTDAVVPKVGRREPNAGAGRFAGGAAGSRLNPALLYKCAK